MSSSSLEESDVIPVSREVLTRISSCTNSELSSVSCPRIFINCKTVLELNKQRSSGNFSWKDFTKWLFALVKNRPSDIPDHKSVRLSVMRVVKEKAELSKNKNKKAVDELLASEFKFPATVVRESRVASCSNSKSDTDRTDADQTDNAEAVLAMSKFVEKRTVEIENLFETITENSKQTAILTQSLKELSLSKFKIDEEFKKMKKEMIELKSKHSKTSEKLNEAMNNLSCAEKDLINSERREKRKEATIINLKIENRELSQLAGASKGLLVDLESSKKARRLEQQSKSRYKIKAKKLEEKVALNEENVLLKSTIKEKEEKIKNLENENMQLEERIEEFINHEVKLFDKNKYKNEIREVYQDIMTLVGGANNVEKIVRKVLEKSAGLKVDRLPKSTFAKYMNLEARGLAQIQLAEELFEKNESLTLYSDGTTKYGFSYGTYDITTADGESRVLGLREMFEGTASTQLETMKEVLADIAAMGNTSNSNLFVQKIVSSVKNVMSDRCIVQKRFNELLAKYRSDILPDVVEGWSHLSLPEQSKLSNMNDFFCGLHFIVGMADQAEAALKVFDTLLYKNPYSVGSLKTKRGIAKGDSGTLRLIRTVCKAVQAKGCEKSGRAVQFLTFLQAEKELETVPLAPFRGNRFNITFYNGSGVYFLFPYLLEFFEGVQSENRLLGAVFDDLHVKGFVAGCRALGLISKIITEPLWKVLEDKAVHILDMSQKYQALLSCFEACAENSLPFLKGELVVFADYKIVKDQMYDKLVQPRDEYDVLTLQALELIFSALVVKTKRMLADHLAEGKYTGAAANTLLAETKSVAKTNVNPERDFGMLDRLMIEKPRATSIVLEGIIMFNKNKTGAWRDQLPEKHKEIVMELARKSKVDQKKIFAARQTTIKKNRMAKLAEKSAEQEQKALKLRIKKEMLMEGIGKLGGLWASESEVRDKLEAFTTENEKIRALHLQIQFRKVVLGAIHCDKTVFQLSSTGKKFDSAKLFSNLCSLLAFSQAEREGNEADEEPELPTCVDKAVLDHQKQLYKEQAEKETGETQGTGKRKQSGTGPRGRKKRKVDDQRETLEKDQSHNHIPIVQVAEDLIGKRVRHLCSTANDEDDSDDGAEESAVEWYNGTVVEMKGIGRNPNFVIRYDGFDGATWKFKLMKHFELGVLELIPVKAEDFVGVWILHRLDIGDGCEEWFRGKVLGVVPDSGDPKNPDFSVEYFYDTDNEEVTDVNDDFDDDEFSTDSSNIEIYPLIEDYLNGDVRFL